MASERILGRKRNGGFGSSKMSDKSGYISPLSPKSPDASRRDFVNHESDQNGGYSPRYTRSPKSYRRDNNIEELENGTPNGAIGGRLAHHKSRHGGDAPPPLPGTSPPPLPLPAGPPSLQSGRPNNFTVTAQIESRPGPKSWPGSPVHQQNAGTVNNGAYENDRMSRSDTSKTGGGSDISSPPVSQKFPRSKSDDAVLTVARIIRNQQNPEENSYLSGNSETRSADQTRPYQNANHLDTAMLNSNESANYRDMKGSKDKSQIPVVRTSPPQRHFSGESPRANSPDPALLPTTTGSSKEGHHSPSSQSMSSIASHTTVITGAQLDSSGGAASISGTKHKHTLGEILRHIEIKAEALMNKENYTGATTLPDLTFLAHQSRYNADPQVKRRIMAKLCEVHVVELFIRVFASVHTEDYLVMLDGHHIVPIMENASNVDPSETHSPESSQQSKSNFSDPRDRLGLHYSGDGVRGLPPTHPMSPRYGAKAESVCSKVKSLDLDGPDKSLANERLHNVPHSMKNLRAALTLLHNTSEKSSWVCDQCIQQGVVSMLLNELANTQFYEAEAMRDQNRMYLVKGYLGILLNIIKFHPHARELYRDAGAVQVLQQYLRSTLLMVKTRSLVMLSYVVSEEENDVIHATERHLALLIKMLQAALGDEGHMSRKHGFTATEVAAAINRYAVCESNKARLVRRNILGHYTQLMGPGCSAEENMVAAKGLWSLAFNDENRARMRQDTPCLEALENLQRSSAREEIRKTASGALWVIQGGHIPDSAHIPDPPGDPTAQHILISYQWGAKTAVFKVKERLRAAGYRVCTDVENTDLPIMEGMAASVNSSAVVLLCVTHRYKESPSCRAEAEYAWRCGRDVIPLRLQQQYMPEGWLAPILENRAMYDVSTEENLDTLLPGLIRELGARARARPMNEFDGLLGASSGSLPKPQDAYTQTGESPGDIFESWSCDRVQHWLKHHELHSVADKLKHVDGQLLGEIRKMKRDAPESFYSTMKHELKMNLVHVLRLTRALDKL